MKEENYNVVGVMSGTSLDGVDLAHIRFSMRDQKWTFEIIESETVGYISDWINKLKSAVDYSETELQKINQDYTKLLASIISDFIKRNKIENLDVNQPYLPTIFTNHIKEQNERFTEEIRK